MTRKYILFCVCLRCGELRNNLLLTFNEPPSISIQQLALLEYLELSHEIHEFAVYVIFCSPYTKAIGMSYPLTIFFSTRYFFCGYKFEPKFGKAN